MTRVGLIVTYRGYVNTKITGIIIDQTHTEGKWYVREVPNKTGDGVAPVFFRREKTDLLGRLIDKAKGVQSAQRYAAKHVHDLYISNPMNPSDINLETLQKRSFPVKKLENDVLANFLDTKAKSAGSKLEDLKVTVINGNQSGPSKALVEDLWKSCTCPSFDDKSNKSQKKEFIRLLNQSLDLSSGRMITNDPSVREECEQFIQNLNENNNLPGHWTLNISEDAQKIWHKLQNNFLQTFTPLGKNTALMTQLLAEISSGRSIEKGDELESLLKTAFQIYYADQTSGTSSSSYHLPWEPVEIPESQERLRHISIRLPTYFKTFNLEYGVLGDLLRQAVEARLR